MLCSAGWCSPTAAAEKCGPDDVTVVVDYAELGDGIRRGCAEGAGGDVASDIFPNAGFPLEYAARSAGFVCRVTKAPADASCVDAAPATAYWSLWWSDGDSDWSYATRGPQSLRIPAGGHVAFVWHEGAGSATPPEVSPGADAADPDDDAAGPPAEGVVDSGRTDDDEGLPLWVPVGAGVVVVGAGVALTWRRRSA